MYLFTYSSIFLKSIYMNIHDITMRYEIIELHAMYTGSIRTSQYVFGFASSLENTAMSCGLMAFARPFFI